MSWRMFIGLEAIDGGGRQFHVAVLRRERSTPAAVRQHPVWLLVRKELRLHAMPVAIAALYFLGWVAANVAARTYDDVLMIFFVLTAFYSTFFALLVGALASAEERLLGTLEWQMLMPIAIRTQWLVKVLVALGLALTLGWGLPILLLQVNAAAHPAILRNGPYLQPLFVGVLMMLTAAGLYASSVATSGLRALLLSLPGLYGAGLFVAWLLNRVEPAIYAAVRAHSMQPGTLFVQDVPELGWLVVGAGFAALVLTFALTNHRSADRPAGRISRQMTWLTASLAAGVTLVAVISAL
jgi:hypothetical protein